MTLPVVFAGPSVHGLPPSHFTGLDMRPPAGRGDVLSAVAEGVPAVGLIDGLYETQPAVWHKEILYALRVGIPVFGAASIGALRAAECAAFGMIGVGGIFAEYANGSRTADADVAVLHAPAELTHEPVTVALVDAEAALAAMAADGHFEAEERDRLIDRARGLHFKLRSWPAILPDPRLAALAARYPGRKASDAVELLRLLQRGAFPRPQPFAFSATGHLGRLARELGIPLWRP